MCVCVFVFVRIVCVCCVRNKKSKTLRLTHLLEHQNTFQLSRKYHEMPRGERGRERERRRASDRSGVRFYSNNPVDTTASAAGEERGDEARGTEREERRMRRRGLVQKNS